jgi:hypothetical protein
MSTGKTAEEYKGCVRDVICLSASSSLYFTAYRIIRLLFLTIYFAFVFVVVIFLNFFFCRLGNDAFAKRDYKVAIECYTKAIQREPKNHIFYSNRRYVRSTIKIQYINVKRAFFSFCII